MRLAFALAAMIVFQALVLVPAPRAEDLALRVELETLPESGSLYRGEMLRIVIRGDYKVPITLEKLEQPSFEGFDWMQLGEDHWFETKERGQRVVSFERRMALFPHSEGMLTISPFRHLLTLSRPNGDRYERSIASEAVAVSVIPAPASAPDEEEWWFPLQKIEIDDSWSNAPQLLAEGEGVLRKIVLTVEGVQPEMIPPMPEMSGAGVAILPHPEVRRTLLRPGGPITQVYWRWSIRPLGGLAGWVNPIDLSYFDAKNRESRNITISAQRVAYASDEGAARAEASNGAEASNSAKGGEAGGQAGVETGPERSNFNPLAQLGVVLCGFAAGLFLMRGVLRRFLRSDFTERLRARLKNAQRRFTLYRAVRRKDGFAARAAAMDYLGARSSDPRFGAALSELDGALFGPTPKRPDLTRFGRIVRAVMSARS